MRGAATDVFSGTSPTQGAIDCSNLVGALRVRIRIFMGGRLNPSFQLPG
jgi:hypothetical protein